METDNIQERLFLEINKLVENRWYFLQMQWPLLEHKFNHRTGIKNMKTNMRAVKDILLNMLGYIPVFYFLVVLYGSAEYPGPYMEIDKGLLLLYQIVSGNTGTEMTEWMPYTSFYDLYKCFWITGKSKLLKKVKKDNECLFSNLKIRLLSAKLFNPDGFKNVTLFIDGHDSKIKYYNPDVSRKTLYSYKLKQPGVRTQTVNDPNEMILFVSNSEKCAMGNDGTMFLKMNLFKKMHIADCLAADGGYTLFVEKFKEMSSNSGYEFSDKNFSYPIRREPGTKLTATELTYNKKFGTFRSGNETLYANLASKFDRFNNNKAAIQISQIEVYNVQMRVAILLMNMCKFVEKFKIEVQPHHMLWHNDNFEFPTKMTRINYVFLNEAKASQNYNEIMELQEQFLNATLDDNDNQIYISSEDEQEDELKHKKVKKVNAVRVEQYK